MFSKKTGESAGAGGGDKRGIAKSLLLSLGGGGRRRRSQSRGKDDKTDDADGLSRQDLSDSKDGDLEFQATLSPLHRAIFNGDDARFAELIDRPSKKKADLLGHVDKAHGRNAVHFCAMRGRLSYLVALLATAGSYQAAEAACQAADGEGLTPLMLAAKYNHVDLMRELLSRFTLNVNAVDKSGNFTALRFAVQTDDALACSLLVQKGADMNRKDVEGNTLLIRAISDCHWQSAAVLIELGCDVTVACSSAPKRTALHVAVLKQQLDLVKMLLGHGANVDAKDSDQRSAVDYAERIHTEAQLSGATSPVSIDDNSNPSAAIYLVLKRAQIRKEQGTHILMEQNNPVAMGSPVPSVKAEVIAVEEMRGSRVSTPASARSTANRSMPQSPIQPRSRTQSYRAQFASKLAQKVGSSAGSDTESADMSFGDMSEESFLDMGFSKAEWEEIQRKKQAKAQKQAKIGLGNNSNILLGLEEEMIAEELAEDLQLELDATASKLKQIRDLLNITPGQEIIEVIRALLESRKSADEQCRSLKRDLELARDDLEDTKQLLGNEQVINQKNAERFQQTISSLEQSIIENKAEIEGLKAQVSSASQEKQELLQENRAQKFANQQLEELKSEHTHVIDSLRKDLELCKMQLTSAQTELAQEQQKIMKEKGSATLTKRENERLIQECNILRAQLSALQKQVRAENPDGVVSEGGLDGVVEAQSIEIDRLKRTLLQLEQEIGEQKEKNIKLENDLKQSGKKKYLTGIHNESVIKMETEVMSSRDVLISEAADEISTIQKKLEAEKTLRQQKQSEIEVAESRISALQSKLSDLEIELKSEKDLHMNDIATIKQLKNELEILKMNCKFKDELETKHASAMRNHLELSQKLQEAELKLQSAVENELKFKHEHALALSLAQTDNDLLQKEMDSLKTTVELQSHELQAIKKGVNNNYFEVLNKQLNIERQNRLKVESDNAKAIKVLQEMESDLSEIHYLYNTQVQANESLRAQKLQVDDLVNCYFEEMNFLQKQVEQLKQRAFEYQQQFVQLERNLHYSSLEIMRLKESENSLKILNEEYVNEIKNLKADVVRGEQKMYDLRAQDKQEIRTLQQQVREAVLSLESKELQLQQSLSSLDISKKELEFVRQELNKIKDLYHSVDRDRSTTEETTGKLSLDLEKRHLEIVTLNDKLVAAEEKRIGMEQQLLEKSRNVVDLENLMALQKRELQNAIKELADFKNVSEESEKQLKTREVALNAFLDDLISICRKSAGQLETLRDPISETLENGSLGFNACWKTVEEIPHALQKVADLWNVLAQRATDGQMSAKKTGVLVQLLFGFFQTLTQKSGSFISTSKQMLKQQIAHESTQLRKEIESLRIDLDDRDQKLTDVKSQMSIQQQSLSEALNASREKKELQAVEEIEEISRTKQDVLELKNSIRSRQHEELSRQIDALQVQLATVRTDYESVTSQFQAAQASWRVEKEKLNVEKTSAIDQSRQYQKTLETLENMLRGSPMLNPPAVLQQSMYVPNADQIMQLVMKKLKDIQHERKLIDSARDQTEREMRDTYERQIQLLMRDITDFKSKLEIAEQKLRRYEGGSVYFKSDAPVATSPRRVQSQRQLHHRSMNVSPARLLADRVDQQMAEVSVLLKERHRP